MASDAYHITAKKKPELHSTVLRTHHLWIITNHSKDGWKQLAS